MSETVSKRSEIPDAPCYVLANDSFMSGWGRAKDMTNTVILPCADYSEAIVVSDNARNRSEMRWVRIVGEKPRLRAGVLYSLMDRENADRWYKRGGFQKSDRA